MSQNVPVGGFKWIEKDDILNFNEDLWNSNKGYLFEIDAEYPKNLHKLHSNLPFLLERMKIGKCSKLVCTVCDKEKYVVHIRALKQALNHGLILKKYIEQYNLIKKHG